MRVVHCLWVLGLLAGGALAQTPSTQTPTPPSPAPPSARGGGGPIPPLPTLQFSSSAWRDGDVIPAKYTQAGHDVSPPLTWSRTPEGTESFVIFVHDLDLATGKGDSYFLAWLVWNIPKDRTSLTEGLHEGGEMGSGMRQISDSGPYYRGPVGPRSDPPHHYLFEIYALSSMLNVPAVMGQSPQSVRAAVQDAMTGKVLAKGTMVGTFQRP